MPDNIDLRDLELEAQAELGEIVDEVMAELMEPMIQRAVRMRWATLSDEAREKIKAGYPDIYDQIVRR